MKSFEQCILDICGLELASLPKGKYAVYGNRIVVVEGHKGIAEYSQEKVSFSFGKAILDICGRQLQIKCLDGQYSVVCGEVCSVAVRNV